MEPLLNDFPVITEISVAWGEMDALQHVNNVIYFRYFETARIDYFKHIALMEETQTSGIGPVLSETQCRYKIPITFPDTLLIGSKVVDIQADRFTMEYQIVSKKIGKVTTTGSATIVMFNFVSGQKVALPATLIQTIQQMEKSETRGW
ncbi:acyl-CoA thioesterase [Vibrio cincinnatiensis]|uniref:acyl-CoA thioesterase n=1 Tax=Vibrio cincinnatiensis TaxID=675 RepID=UPI001EDE5749|nr:thioesterase family protein [Vibrio cincinnatiensis]MCG3731795.1 acyl-CoA thioesterase [Vibrio cincinnatiensis]